MRLAMTGEPIADFNGVKESLQALQREMLVGIALGETPSNVMTSFCRGVEELAEEVICSIVGVDDEGRLSLLSGPSLPEAYARSISGVRVGPEVGSCGRAIALKQPVEVTDIENDPLWADYTSLALPFGLRACWSCPIIAQDGRVLGAFAFYFKVPRGVGALERYIAQECAGFCAVAIENSEARAKLNNLAFFDTLTGLGNRVTLKNRLGIVLQRAEEVERSVGIFHIDLAEFRAVNDLHGRAIGDKALVQVAQRMRSIAWDSDLIVRMGGDEFLIVKTAPSPEFQFDAFAEKLVAGLRDRYQLDKGEQVAIDVRIGVAQFPADGNDQDELIANAETALHRAKRSGRGYILFDSQMLLEQRRLRAMERDVGLALERGELAIVFQPQVEARSGVIRAFEALLRWRHPVHGDISPADFIPVAEANGAIIAMGAFVLREACRTAARWSEKLRIAVNVSPAQIVQDDFVQVVVRILAETGLEAERLELEVTESLFIQDSDSASIVLRRLKKLGVSVAIDDFGTGYSSLSTLRTFPFDRIKVDRSFVCDMTRSSDAAAIVNSVIGLGRAMGLRVIAEGVDSEEQVALLQTSGCHEIQGYLFGKPLPAESYAHVMRPRTPLEDRSLAAS